MRRGVAAQDGPVVHIVGVVGAPGDVVGRDQDVVKVLGQSEGESEVSSRHVCVLKRAIMHGASTPTPPPTSHPTLPPTAWTLTMGCRLSKVLKAGSARAKYS